MTTSTTPSPAEGTTTFPTTLRLSWAPVQRHVASVSEFALRLVTYALVAIGTTCLLALVAALVFGGTLSLVAYATVSPTSDFLVVGIGAWLAVAAVYVLCVWTKQELEKVEKGE